MILSKINIELTSRCNKSCHMCGRRKLERDHPDKCDWGDMPIELVYKISEQIPPGTIVQLHWNGEPLLYPTLSRALSYFKHCITGLDTNGKLLVSKADEIIGNLDTITISVIENDEPLEASVQMSNIKKFIDIKGDRKPNVVYRLLGNIDPESFRELPGKIATRVLHNPMGSYGYRKPVIIPEMGICMDMLTSVAIDRYGHVSHCVRFDPDKLGIIGDVNKASLSEIVNSVESQPWQKGKHLRKHYVNLHVAGRRDEVPLCWQSKCEYYGCPVGHQYEPASEEQDTKRSRGRPRLTQ